LVRLSPFFPGLIIDPINEGNVRTWDQMPVRTVLTQRAAAYLKTGQPEIAATEYQKNLANPGIDPISPLFHLAHLGLARAYASQNNISASRVEYEKFLDSWKDADADMPILKQARIEYARLKVS
jgi:Tfp pilus assembly protein PilF